MKFVDASGRSVGQSYIPSCQLNYNLQEKYSLMDTHDYRYFLQQNSEKVKQDIDVDASGVESCKICPVCQASLAYNPKNSLLLGGSQQIVAHNHNIQQHATATSNSFPKPLANNWNSYL
jgi:hypothetical protein